MGRADDARLTDLRLYRWAFVPALVAFVAMMFSAAPAVAEADDLVAVLADPLPDHRPDDGVEAGAVAAAPPPVGNMQRRPWGEPMTRG